MLNQKIIELAKEANLLEIIDEAYLCREDWPSYVQDFYNLVRTEALEEAEKERDDNRHVLHALHEEKERMAEEIERLRLKLHEERYDI